MKKFLTVAVVCLLALCFAAPCFATGVNNPDLPRVVDNADLFLDIEEQELTKAISLLTSKYGQDILIMTIDQYHNETHDEIIERIWDENGFGVGQYNDGWAIFVCMYDRTWIHNACGYGTTYLSYDSVNIIDDYMEPFMRSGNYYDAMMVALGELDSLFEMGEKEYVNNTYAPDPGYDPGYDPGHEPEEPSLADKLATGGIGGALVGIIAGFISMGSAKNSMKTVSSAYSAGNYIQRGSFNLSRAEDILLNVRVTRVEKAQQQHNPDQPHHSGASSFSGPHHSSGGNIHSSGGGRHF